MAKNQYSLSDDPKKLGRPEHFEITIREVYVNAGAGFVVAITGTVMTMPGLPLHPAAERIDVTDDGVIVGLSQAVAVYGNTGKRSLLLRKNKKNK